MAIRNSTYHKRSIWDPIWGKGRSYALIAPLERAMLVSYRLSVVTIALSLKTSGRNLPSNFCDAQSTGVGSLGSKFYGVPFRLSKGDTLQLLPTPCLFERRRIRDVGVCWELTLRANPEIIFEGFQPMWSQYLNVTDGQMGKQRDGLTTCCSNRQNRL